MKLEVLLQIKKNWQNKNASKTLKVTKYNINKLILQNLSEHLNQTF